MITRRWLPAEVKDRAGNVLAAVNARIWRTTTAATPGGQRYDYRGVCSPEARESLVGQQNRLIDFIDGPTYRVVDAIFYPILNYLEVICVEVKADG